MKQRILAFLAVLLMLPGLAQAKIFLVDTDDTLRVVTASGVSTIHMYAAWADLTTTALTPGASDAQVTTATTTVLVAAPGSSTQRQIKGLSIRNAHASSSNVITVEFFDGATATELIQYTLLAGETLQWGEDENFRIIDASGQVKGAVTANAGANLNTSALLTTSAHDAAFGTAGSADAQVRSVQGIASMTPLLVNPGTAANFGVYAEDSVHASGDNLVLAGVVRSDAAAALAADGDRTVLQVDANGYLKVANQNPNLAADNSTLSTAKVPVLPGTVSTSAPTWTNGNQSALSLQTDGSVRSAITNTVTVSATNLDVQIGGSDSLTIGTFPDNEPFNIAQMNGVAVTMGNGISGTGVQRVTIASDSTGQVALATGSNTIGALTANQSVNVAQMNGVTPLMGAGATGTGSQRVTEANDSQLSAGVGATGDAAATAGSTGSLTAKLRLMTSQLDAIQTAVQLIDDDQTGATMHHRVSVGTTEDEHEIKGSAGRLFSINVTNTNAAVRYLRCANQVIGSTTPGTTAVWYGMAIPGATTGAGYTATFGPAGVAFSTGLTCWLVTGAAETDVTEVAANEINVNYTYK